MKPVRKRSFFRRIADLGITDDMTATDAKHVRVTNIVAVIAPSMLLLWVPVAIWAGQPTIAIQNLLMIFVFLLVLPLNLMYRHRESASLLLIAGHAQLIFALLVFGTPSGSHFFYPMMLVSPYVIFRRRHRRVAHLFAAYAGFSMVWFLANQDNYPTQVVLMDARYQGPLNAAIALGGLLLTVAAFLSSVDQTEDALDRARARADALLLNVLPPSIAERLKADPDEAIADRHSQVTILFADIVGFTPLSSRMSPIETVELLNDVFTAFDEICDQAGVEKIRTIGDGYMAICGAPAPRADHAETLTQVAIEMRDCMAARPPGDPLQVRIGLNSGEVVAGIVGTSRFHYDVWGDVVNVAARMESLGEPGRIHIARPTWELIHDRFPCESRGWIPVKGKGEMESWFVL